MIFGKIVKQFVCTIKDPNLNAVKIFKVKLLNLNLSESERYVITVDNRLGLGPGDIVLMVVGSGARKLEGNAEMPIDCAITAKVETVNIDKKYEFLL